MAKTTKKTVKKTSAKRRRPKKPREKTAKGKNSQGQTGPSLKIGGRKKSFAEPQTSPQTSTSNGRSQFTAECVLAIRFISYAPPLDLARRWLQSGEAHQIEQGRKLLEGLYNRFGHSLEIGHHLALAYLEEGDESKSKQVLDRLSLICRNPNEEVLSRCGRLYRDQGDRHVKYPDIGGPSESSRDAVRFYRRALDEYEAAYKIRLGHYPGVNVATLRLLIAAFQESDNSQRSRCLNDCESIASELLARRDSWPLLYNHSLHPLRRFSCRLVGAGCLFGVWLCHIISLSPIHRLHRRDSQPTSPSKYRAGIPLVFVAKLIVPWPELQRLRHAKCIGPCANSGHEYD